ncbi:MAG: BatA domain-containing protein [Verrucomicrobiae bacterium]|nr:BatA domain-containing protein [Verrucomicrobiae bacterium]
MSFSFGNLLGFWALLGIPAVLLIHFLQRRSRTVVISTLFLLDQMQRESVSGNRIERLRTSVPLWLQLLAVALLTWLLTQPRWMQTQAVQRIAIVIDSSASMSVFRDKAAEKIDTTLDDLTSLVTVAEYVLLETRGSRSLTTGTNRADLLKALAAWEPYTGTHDPAPALRLARSTVGADGLVIFVTDHPQENPPPFEARLLAVGTPIENCGFAGFTVETGEDGQWRWKVLAQNYGTQTQTRQWWLRSGDQRTTPAQLTLEPQKATPLQGAFPAGAKQCTLEMQADTFALDDRLPMVAPALKQLTVRLPENDSTDAYDNFYRKVFGSFANVSIVTNNEKADIDVSTYDPLDPALPNKSSCVFAHDPRQRSDFLNGQIVSAAHPLIDNLNWQGLLCRESIQIPARASDDVILWQGDRPLIFVRRLTNNGSQLCFNFDLRKSNAQRLPAFAVLLHRFLATVRDSKIASEARNFEVGQAIQLTRDRQPDAPSLITRVASGSESEIPSNLPGTILRAPSQAGFFEIFQGEQRLLNGATHFADTREADFRAAGSASTLDSARAAIVKTHSQTDGNWRLWVLLLLAVLLISWHYARPRSAASPTSPAPLRTHP